MAVKVDRFEDLKVWQEARSLASAVYQAVNGSERLARDYRFRDQITSAAVSVMSNIAEGFSRRTNREFTLFLFIAKGSCAEVQSLLYTALDQGYVTEEQFAAIYQQTDLVARFLSRFITYLIRQTQPTQNPKDPTNSIKRNERDKPKKPESTQQTRQLNGPKKLKNSTNWS